MKRAKIHENILTIPNLGHSSHETHIMISNGDFMNTSPKITISYLNVCGLTDVKLSTLCTKLNDHDTLLFVAETWYINHDGRLAHPLVIASTHAPPRRHPFRRRDHGMLLLAPPSLASRIHVKRCTEFCIMIHLDEHISIAAVYFPPSMQPQMMHDELHALGPISVLMGDMNVRLGVHVGDSISGPSDRMTILGGILDQYGLVHVRPHAPSPPMEDIVTRVDHVFACSNLVGQCQLSLEAAPVSTDHPLLKVRIKLRPSSLPLSPLASQQTHPFGSTKRFCMSALENKILANLYGQYVECLCGPLLSHLSQFQTPNADLIDFLDMALVEILQCVLEDVVGTYDPSKMHSSISSMSPPRYDSINTLTMMMNHVETLRLFKRLQRTKYQDRQLCSMDPSKSPLEEAYLHFSELFRQKFPTSNDDDNGNNNDTLTSVMDDSPILDIPNPFCQASITWAIQTYPGCKSPGLDGIDIRALRCALSNEYCSSFISCLSMLFQWCFQLGYTPRRWNVVVIHPIPKMAKTATTTSTPTSTSTTTTTTTSTTTSTSRTIPHCRPISLTMLFRRLFEKILLPDLSSSLCFNRGQAGFRSGFSCLTHILLANETNHHHRKTTSIKVLIDLKSAYDSVNIHRLLAKMHHRKIHPTLIALVSSLFLPSMENISMVAINGILSASFPRERGLLQGSLLAPWLFNLYIDDLAMELNECHRAPGLDIAYDSISDAGSDFNTGVNPNSDYTLASHHQLPPCLLFADDILLQSNSEPHMHHMLHVLHHWCKTNHMEVNIAKCGVLIYPPPSHEILSFRLGQHGPEIPMVASYTYLGMPSTMDAKGGPDVLAHMVRRNAQAETILAALSQHIACASWPEMAKLSIYKTFIRPIIEYAAPLILPTMQLAKMVSHPKRKRKRKKKRPHREADSRDVPPRCPPNPITMLTMLENTQKRALSWIFGRKIPHAVLLSLAGLSPISLRLEELSTRFLGHLSRMHSGQSTTFSCNHNFLISFSPIEWCIEPPS